MSEEEVEHSCLRDAQAKHRGSLPLPESSLFLFSLPVKFLELRVVDLDDRQAAGRVLARFGACNRIRRGSAGDSLSGFFESSASYGDSGRSRFWETRLTIVNAHRLQVVWFGFGSRVRVGIADRLLWDSRHDQDQTGLGMRLQEHEA